MLHCSLYIQCQSFWPTTNTRGRQAWQPMMPRQTARLLAATLPGGPAATQLVSFSDSLVSSPSQQEQPRIRPGTVFLLPCGEVFARPGLAAPSQPPQRQYLQRQQKPPTRIDLWHCPLFSWGQCLGGSPVEAAYASGSWLGPVPLYTVYSPCKYVNCYVCSNKLVLSYVLSSLLFVHKWPFFDISLYQLIFLYSYICIFVIQMPKYGWIPL
jgi:hypothetical protein